MPSASILLVDDELINLKVYRALLGKEDYDLVAVDSGTEALEIVTANPTFDLILLDVAIPDLDGIEVCRRLKSAPSTAHIPIVLVSGFRIDDDSIREGMAVGADGYLTKPIDDVALRSWVKATLRISTLQRELSDRVPDMPRRGKELQGALDELSRDVNAPLQAMYAGVERLAAALPKDGESQQLLAQITENAEKVADIIAQASITAMMPRK